MECVNLLADNGVEHVVLKGPIFALQAYHNLSLRQFSDLDILIHPKDFPKVYDLLEASGFVPKHKLGRKQKNSGFGHTTNIPSISREILLKSIGMLPLEKI